MFSRLGFELDGTEVPIIVTCKILAGGATAAFYAAFDVLTEE